MKREEYEQRKRRLDEQFREGTALLEAAHRQQLRALELVWMTTADEDLALGAAGPDAGPAAIPSAPPPPAPSRPRRRGAGELAEEVEAVLAVVPEVFDRNDVCRALGYEPDRGSLYRVIQELMREGSLTIQRKGSGKATTRYRKIQAGSPPPGL